MNFTVGVFNIDVRRCVRELDDDQWDEQGTGISADFAEVIYFDYPNCSSIEMVEQKVESQFPKSKGFRIDFIKSFKD